MKIRRKFLAAAMAATIALQSAGPASADLESSLSNMLGANVQVNSPGSVQTARRGGFYGGSIYVRGRVMNVTTFMNTHEYLVRNHSPLR